MKKIAAGVLLVLALAGCSSAPAALPEAKFFELSHEISDLFASMDNETLTEIGKGACDILDAGGDDGWLLAVKTFTDQDIDAKDAGMFITYAASTYCPGSMDSFPSAG